MLPRKLEMRIENTILKESFTGSESLLGCHIDGSLKWNSQVRLLVGKLIKRLNYLLSLQNICSFSMRKTLAEGLFNSVMIYCLPLFGGLNKNMRNQIQTVQNRAARFVCNAPPRSNRSALFRKIGWMTVDQLIQYHTLISVFKIRCAKQPEYLAGFLCTDSRNHRIMMRHRINLTLFQDSFCARGANQWNKLPYQLRSIVKLKEWILANVPQFED